MSATHVKCRHQVTFALPQKRETEARKKAAASVETVSWHGKLQ